MNTAYTPVLSAHRIHLNTVLAAVADLVHPDPAIRHGAHQRLTLAVQRLEETFGEPPTTPTGWPAAQAEAERAAWHARAAARALADQPAFPTTVDDTAALGGLLRAFSAIGASTHNIGLNVHDSASTAASAAGRGQKGPLLAIRDRIRTTLVPAERIENTLGDIAREVGAA